jgi:hypothetical protein
VELEEELEGDPVRKTASEAVPTMIRTPTNRTAISGENPFRRRECGEIPNRE